jgi:hypothetical protein
MIRVEAPARRGLGERYHGEIRDAHGDWAVSMPVFPVRKPER